VKASVDRARSQAWFKQATERVFRENRDALIAMS